MSLCRGLFPPSLIDTLKNQGINVETGIFGADMKVDLLNDGPVTLVIDSI